MAPFDRSHTSSYSSSMVTMALSYSRRNFVNMFDAVKTRMIELPYGEKLWQYVKPFSSDTGTSGTDGWRDRQTELLYQYRASVCWRAIKNRFEWEIHKNIPRSMTVSIWFHGKKDYWKHLCRSFWLIKCLRFQFEKIDPNHIFATISDSKRPNLYVYFKNWISCKLLKVGYNLHTFIF